MTQHEREVMQMVLDALESLQAWPETPENFKRFRAIEALRTALAQPDPEHDLEDVRCEGCGYMTYHREHMGCIRAAAQPESKPAAWLDPLAQKSVTLDYEAYGVKGIPLYIAPPQREWVGLTDEEMTECYRHYEGFTVFESYIFEAVVREVHATLKEKNA